MRGCRPLCVCHLVPAKQLSGHLQVAQASQEAADPGTEIATKAIYCLQVAQACQEAADSGDETAALFACYQIDRLLACLQVAQASQEAADPGDEIAALVQTMGSDSSSSTTFKEGDRVLVTEGDLKNLDGVVVSVNEEGKLMVKASLAELAGNAPLTIDAQHVVKFFQVGLRKHSVKKTLGVTCYVSCCAKGSSDHRHSACG